MPTPNQPGPYDAVLGGAPDATVRAAALPKALTYGEAGLDLVIEVLRDDLQGLADEADEVLRQRPEAKAQDAVARYEIRSEKGIDYTRLRDLLKAGKWREANKETYEVMRRAVGWNSDDYWIRSDEYRTFPCMDLQTIDRLWVSYSQGKFGFSVQKQIYVECGAKLDGEYPGDKIWHTFCERVGWRKGNSYLHYEDLKANPSFSPTGELPGLVLWGLCRCGFCRWWRYGFFSRTETCKL